MSWTLEGQHDNGGLVYLNKHDLLFIVINPNDGTVAFYHKKNIEKYKNDISIDEYEDYNDYSTLIDYLFERNDWSSTCNNMEITKLIDELLF